jgi:hypothetical protein
MLLLLVGGGRIGATEGFGFERRPRCLLLRGAAVLGLSMIKVV